MPLFCEIAEYPEQVDVVAPGVDVCQGGRVVNRAALVVVAGVGLTGCGPAPQPVAQEALPPTPLTQAPVPEGPVREEMVVVDVEPVSGPVRDTMVATNVMFNYEEVRPGEPIVIPDGYLPEIGVVDQTGGVSIPNLDMNKVRRFMEGVPLPGEIVFITDPGLILGFQGEFVPPFEDVPEWARELPLYKGLLVEGKWRVYICLGPDWETYRGQTVWGNPDNVETLLAHELTHVRFYYDSSKDTRMEEQVDNAAAERLKTHDLMAEF